MVIKKKKKHCHACCLRSKMTPIGNEWEICKIQKISCVYNLQIIHAAEKEVHSNEAVTL